MESLNKSLILDPGIAVRTHVFATLREAEPDLVSLHPLARALAWREIGLHTERAGEFASIVKDALATLWLVGATPDQGISKNIDQDGKIKHIYGTPYAEENVSHIISLRVDDKKFKLDFRSSGSASFAGGYKEAPDRVIAYYEMKFSDLDFDALRSFSIERNFLERTWINFANADPVAELDGDDAGVIGSINFSCDSINDISRQLFTCDCTYIPEYNREYENGFWARYGTYNLNYYKRKHAEDWIGMIDVLTDDEKESLKLSKYKRNNDKLWISMTRIYRSYKNGVVIPDVFTFYIGDSMGWMPPKPSVIVADVANDDDKDVGEANVKAGSMSVALFQFGICENDPDLPKDDKVNKFEINQISCNIQKLMRSIKLD